MKHLKNQQKFLHFLRDSKIVHCYSTQKANSAVFLRIIYWDKFLGKKISLWQKWDQKGPSLTANGKIGLKVLDGVVPILFGKQTMLFSHLAIVSCELTSFVFTTVGRYRPLQLDLCLCKSKLCSTVLSVVKVSLYRHFLSWLLT